MHDSTGNTALAQHPSSTPGSVHAARCPRILAIDLGKFKSVACDYDPATGTHRFTTLPL